MADGPRTAAAAARALDEAALLEYVKSRRWFGAKGGAPTAARVVDVMPLPWDDEAFAIARLEVTTASGALRYQLPVAARAQLPAGATAIARSGDVHVYDAVEDPDFRRRLVHAFGHGCRMEEEDRAWVVEPEGAKTLVLPPDAEIRLGSAEQSNTSMRIGSAAILKLYRRIEPGEHPDVEITRFLTTQHGFPNTPVLLGSIHWEDPDGTRTVGGMIQELVPEAKDAWEYALETGRPYFGAPRDASPENAFAADAAQLGRVTRTMHEVLASDATDPAFAAEKVKESTVEAWGERARHQVTSAIQLLERQVGAGALAGDRLEEAKVVVRRREHYLELIDEIVDDVEEDPGLCIRHHGDYHLGQVLRTAAGEFMVIDFEGEPARSLEERRRKQSGLRDVAGMLRSFAYAAATLAAEANGRRGGGLDPGTVEVRAGRWERDAREGFLQAYFAGEMPAFLPRKAEHARKLLALFEIEKVFYELAYELNNRPEWVRIPLRGVARLTFGSRR